MGQHILAGGYNARSTEGNNKTNEGKSEAARERDLQCIAKERAERVLLRDEARSDELEDREPHSNVRLRRLAE